MKNLFKWKYYTEVVTLSIILVTFLIIFNLVDMTNEIKEKRLTGLAISENNIENSDVYNLKSYFIYTIIITVFIVVILGLIIKNLFPSYR